MKRWIFVLSVILVSCAKAPVPTPSPVTTTPAPVVAPTAVAGQPTTVPAGPAVPAPAGIKATSLGIEYLNPVPMTDIIKAKRGPVRTDKKVVPFITWGADEATIYANGGRRTQQGSIVQREGLNIELSREDNVVRAVEKVISGETPYFRGTIDMVLSGVEALGAQGLEMEVIYLFSRSTGGDTLVVRPGIEKIVDLKGKTIGLQLYGPHMLFLVTILDAAGLSVSDVKIKWLRELTLPPYETPVIVDPASAFEKDSGLDAVVVITPDMLKLTSGGKIGKGGDGSVKGAKMLFSSKTLPNVIYDIYAVRKDYLEANRSEVQEFVHALLLGQEAQVALFNASQQRKQEYDAFLKTAAELLMDSAQRTADVEGMYADMTFAGYTLNVQFFTDKKDLRRFELVKKEAEQALIGYGLLSGPVTLNAVSWDYNVLAKGLKDTFGVVAPRFDPVKVEKFVQKSGAMQGIFDFPIQFGANQADFPVDAYRADFDRTIEQARKYGGALIVIEGHFDPALYNNAKSSGVSDADLLSIRKSANLVSYKRAEAVREAVMAYAKERGVKIDPSQFTVMGYGVDKPLYPNVTTESTTEMRDKRAQNRRVVFKFVAVEGEIE